MQPQKPESKKHVSPARRAVNIVLVLLALAFVGYLAYEFLNLGSGGTSYTKITPEN